MRPERILGTDPAAGDLVAADDVLAVLRECVLVLSEGRRAVEHVIRPDGLWVGAHAAVVTGALGSYVSRLRHVEDAVVDFTQAWQRWRTEMAGRKDDTAELVEALTQLPDAADGSTDPRRSALLHQVGAVAERHAADAAEIVAAAESLIEDTTPSAAEQDLVADLHRGLQALAAAVEEWLAESGEELRRATASVGSVADLTAVVPQLVGLGARSEPAQQAVRVAMTAPGSHRLLAALEREQPDRAAADLPVASFDLPDTGAPALSDRLRGAVGPAERTTMPPATEPQDER